MALLNLGKRLTHRRVQQSILRSFFSYNSSDYKQINSLLSTHKVACGYLPYVRHQTKALIYNFFSTNYGIRNPSHLFVSITDKNFSPIHTVYKTIHYRESILIDFADFEKDFSAEPTFVVAFIANKFLRPNHGGAGGHLRFWGIWGNNSASTHSWPLPGIQAFIRSTLKLSLHTPFERRFYPPEAPRITNHSPFHPTLEVSARGDLSLDPKLSPGFTFIYNKHFDIKSVFHGRNLTRSFHSNAANIPQIQHVVAVPAIHNIDCQLWFGECCSSDSMFEYQIYKNNSNSSNSSADLLYSSTIQVTNKPISLSSLIPSDILGSFDLWVCFNPLSGSFSRFYVNCIYFFRSHSAISWGDAVHSHSFASLKDRGFKRALKFFPFNFETSTSSTSIYNKLAIWGAVETHHQVRLRIFTCDDSSFEHLEMLTVHKSSVLFVDLDSIIAGKFPPHLHSSICIAQIECDSSNLNSTMFFSRINHSVPTQSSILIDHLTGG